MEVMSAHSGMIGWTMVVEHLSEIMAGNDKLAADDSLTDLYEQSETDNLFVGPMSETLLQIVSGMPDVASESPEYVLVVSGSIAPGHLAAGMAGGVEIAAAGARISGLPTLFVADVTGEYGGIGWITGASDLTTLEESTTRVTSDPSFVELADGIGPAYLPHLPMSIFRRIN